MHTHRTVLGLQNFDAEELAAVLQEVNGNRCHMRLVAINDVVLPDLIIEDITRGATAWDPELEITTLSVWFGSDMVGMDINDGSTVTIDIRKS